MPKQPWRDAIDYPQIHNVASHFTHHATEAEALADFQSCIDRGCNEGWRECELNWARNKIRSHFTPGNRAVLFREFPPSPQDAKNPYRPNGSGADTRKGGW